MKKNLIDHWYEFHFYWQQYQSTLLYLHRQHELERLLKWAKRKKLGVQDFYAKQLWETESKLFTKRVRHPQSFRWAVVAYHVNKLLSPDPHYYPKGYGAKYRIRAV